MNFLLVYIICAVLCYSVHRLMVYIEYDHWTLRDRVWCITYSLIPVFNVVFTVFSLIGLVVIIILNFDIDDYSCYKKYFGNIDWNRRVKW